MEKLKPMNEYFIVANSFAAPFCSDYSREFVKAKSPEEALLKFAGTYTHPAGLYAAACYQDANAEAKGDKPLAKWLSNHAKTIADKTRKLGCYSLKSNGPGDFEINDDRFIIDKPKDGVVVLT